jgi:probable F420-dependent oxidoreductase
MAHMNIGKLSIHCIADGLSAEDSVNLARKVETAGFGALWLAEFMGRDVFSHADYLLSHTSKLVIGTGIANLYARDPRTTLAAQLTLNELHDNRFFLGLGVSHSTLVKDVRGLDYGKPVTTMRHYLTEMEKQKASYAGPQPSQRPPTLLAALRPKMLALSAELADGAMPCWVNPEHTAKAREILGPNALLCPIQNVMLETDPTKARAAIRQHVAMAMTLPNYVSNLKWLGFSDADFANGCSDRLVDALVAWGDESAIRKRIDAHFAAGADHICIYPQHPDPLEMLALDTRVIDAFAIGQ